MYRNTPSCIYWSEGPPHTHTHTHLPYAQINTWFTHGLHGPCCLCRCQLQLNDLSVFHFSVTMIWLCNKSTRERKFSYNYPSPFLDLFCPTIMNHKYTKKRAAHKYYHSALSKAFFKSTGKTNKITAMKWTQAGWNLILKHITQSEILTRWRGRWLRLVHSYESAESVRVTQVEARGVSAALLIVPGALCDSGRGSTSCSLYQHSFSSTHANGSC